MIEKRLVNYYHSAGGQVNGPYLLEDLDQWYRSGRIDPDSMVCPEGTEDWVSLRSLLGSAAGLSIPAPNQGRGPAQINVYLPPKSPGVAILLEILPGFFLQTFGIGNLYAGNVATGLILMLTYWAATVVNAILTVFLIGLVTWPLTWIVYLVVGIITAQNSAVRANQQLLHAVTTSR